MVSQSDLLPMITATRGSGGFPILRSDSIGADSLLAVKIVTGDSPMKRGIWVAVAVAIAVAGAWGYGALVRQENDGGRRGLLPAVAAGQRPPLPFSPSRRPLTPLPEER